MWVLLFSFLGFKRTLISGFLYCWCIQERVHCPGRRSTVIWHLPAVSCSRSTCSFWHEVSCFSGFPPTNFCTSALVSHGQELPKKLPLIHHYLDQRLSYVYPLWTSPQDQISLISEGFVKLYCNLMDSPDPPFLLLPFLRAFLFQNVCIPLPVSASQKAWCDKWSVSALYRCHCLGYYDSIKVLKSG